jgi:hypothetical protein
MKTILSITLLTMFMSSCDENPKHSTEETIIETLTDELSREDALRILKEEYRGEQCSGDIWNKGIYRDDDYQNNLNYLIDLENQGLVTIEYKKNGTDNESASFTLTGAGAERYDHNSYRTALTEERPKEIIGMSSVDDRTTIVAFSVVVEQTPFYGLSSRYGQEKCPLDGTNEREVTFVKYDTGWRIKKSN